MGDSEIRRKLEEYVQEIFYGVHSIPEARALEERLDVFCKENNVTDEQLSIFIETGAGEMLSMMTSAPI